MIRKGECRRRDVEPLGKTLAKAPETFENLDAFRGIRHGYTAFLVLLLLFLFCVNYEFNGFLNQASAPILYL